MKTYFTVFVVVFAILNFVHDSQEFSAGAGTVTGRRTFDEVNCFKEIQHILKRFAFYYCIFL
jgi:hypothetical protein